MGSSEWPEGAERLASEVLKTRAFPCKCTFCVHFGRVISVGLTGNGLQQTL